MNLLNRLKNTKDNIIKKENIFYLIIILIIFFLDRVSKFKIINYFSDSPYFINKYINLDLIWNVGIGFGLLSTNSTLFYNLVTFLIGSVIIFLIYFFAFSKAIDKFVYSIIIGGALGNFYDRLIYKAVPDFIDLHYNNFHWFVFNIADIFITIGIVALLLNGLLIKD